MRHFLLLGNVLLLLATLAPIRTNAAGAPDGQPVAGITARLGGPDKSARLDAAAELRKLGQAPLQALLDALANGTPAQRRGGAIGLALLPMPAYGTDGLLAALADDDPSVRGLAAHTLAVIGPSAAPRVAALLNSPDANTAHGAAYALILMKENAVPALAGTLATDDPSLRAKAAWILGRLGPAALTAVPALVRALDCSDPRAMHVVAEAIELIGPAPSVLLFHLLQINQHGNHPMTRLGTGAAPTLIKLLNRPGTLTGQTAFRALAAMGSAAEPALVEAIEAGTPGQRIAAALLLVEIDPDNIVRLPDDVRDTLAGAGRE
ncbi:HEAT repeat domain-containing protein [Pseudodesulfovibrio sp.]|uniref:HEAT repeat domain-containing protein n=1 Tax=unclassified Pseudodesulfovibrio TaxID=2661612 RepID=UPI003B006747